ncbi:MAG: 4Fe-4S dicluster domain-containing protein [Bacteroidota bacterium]|nr:4Fe-4S dicluster domain-containing protein [Bacteroidota bacterium]
MAQKGILIDITKCIGCQQCVSACKIQNNLPDTEETKLSITAYTVVEEKEERYVRRMCMHCKYPTCESVCPVGAFEHTKEGAVLYHAEKCIGCRYCMMACPFQAPRYEWASRTPQIQKCKLCIERITIGKETACTEACPVGATIFGDYNDILRIARQTVSAEPDKYVNHIYGENEVGGTSILYISDVPFEKLGFKTNLGTQKLPELTWSALSKIPSVVAVGGTLLYGIWWITNRRKEVIEFERKMKESQTNNPDEEN